jgi:23S rRNA (guanosine2251-2'-O)-methyltransferase
MAGAREHLEGRQSVLAALSAFHRRIEVILIRRGMHMEKYADVVALAESRGVAIRFVERPELDALAHGGTHGGIVAICSPKPRLSTRELLELVTRLRHAPLLLLLEGVDDARNLGFTLRTAEAMGVDAVLIKKHIWDLDAVEISRPSSGAYERLPLAQIDDVQALRELKKAGVQLVGCLARAKRPMCDYDLRGPTLLAIGGEKRGLSGAVRDVCNRFVSIPTVGGASSLSLSHAAAIILAESFRQRRGDARQLSDPSQVME